ncbi:MAG: PKD domain-containing protein [Gammaproteobacteria bacterium]|nr:PKD domain-containing protein [Gammaproteobacteria bacterium]
MAAMNNAYSITLTQPTTISATNSSYDGQDLIVNSITLTIDGSHQFNSVQLINGAVLTHSLSPSAKLEITSNTFFIDASSSIDLTAKGHLPTSAVTGASGGSYGGLGGIYINGGTTNPVFGSATLPTDFGIGGIGSAGKTYGGGSIKLITNELTLNGRIIADGQSFNTFFSSQGGGSGGSILLDVGILNGNGTLETSGGSGFTFYGGGGGGGGRIAVYYDTANFDFQNHIINDGGVCKPLFGEYGQPGSIYIENKTAANQAPIANAGNSLAVSEQSEVTLTGSATDADGVITRYSWTQLSGPTVSLINANTATPSFTAPTVLSDNSPTVLQFRLTVVDDQGAAASADISIGVLAVNALPVANAGADVSTNEATNVNLIGAGNDSDGTITAYQWAQMSGTAVTLSNSTNSTTSFATPVVKNTEQLTFRLTVTDNESGSHSDDVLVTVNPVNALPVAQIVNPAPVAENTFAALDGSTSNDTDGMIVSYSWTQIAGPTVALTTSTRASTSFTTPTVYQDTVLSFRLDIADNEGGSASATTQLTVYDVNTDDDVDGMLDAWEILFFNTLDHNGSTDTDGDGATDLQEFNFGTDPTAEQQPAQPEIVSPDNIEVTSLLPELTLTNPRQHTGFPVSYEFEVYRDAAMTDLITSASGTGLTWSVNTTLSDNSWYYWRARAIGASLFSGWVSSKFFVNAANDAPGTFNISYPQDGVWVASFTPTLSVTNSVDVDGDALGYQFEVYTDANLISASGNILPGSNGTTSWTVDVPLLENNVYLWRAVVTDEHGLSTISSSEPMIFINTVNDAPAMPALSTPSDGSEITNLYTDLIVNNVTDPESEPVYYLFELDTINTFDSANHQSSGAVSETLNVTGWSVNALLDNTWYYWRAKSSDDLAESLWANGRFFVNQFNDAPGITKALNPGDHAWTGNLQPTLEVYPAIDIDGDALSYEFNVYKVVTNSIDPELVASGTSNSTFWQLDAQLNESGYYYWHARAIDEHGLAGEWGNLVVFFADDDGINDTPVIKLRNLDSDNHSSNKNDEHDNDESPSSEDDAESHVEINWTDYDPDSNAHISLYYDTDQYGEDGTLIIADVLEDPDGDADRYLWDISQMPAGVYFVYAIIDDGNSTSVDYSNNAVIVGDGGGQPYLTFKTSETENKGKRNQRALISWRDLDSDSNASISLYYDTDSAGFDGALIVDGLAEDPDGNGDHFLWDISAQAEGTYYLYATVSDETNTYRGYADKPIVIEHHGQDRD